MIADLHKAIGSCYFYISTKLLLCVKQNIEELERELLADIAKMETAPGHHQDRSPFFPALDSPMLTVTHDLDPATRLEVAQGRHGSRSPSPLAQRAVTPSPKQEIITTSKFFQTPGLTASSKKITVWRDGDNSSKKVSDKKVHFGTESDGQRVESFDRKPSPLKFLSPNIRLDEHKSPTKSPKRLSKQTVQTFRLSSVPELLTSPQKKSVWFEQKENLSPYKSATKDDSMALKTDWHNCTIEDLNVTLSESVVQFEQLESKADRLRCDPQPLSNEKILKQLEAIQRKQKKLVKIQETLQQQLILQLEGSNQSKVVQKQKQTDSSPKRVPEIQDSGVSGTKKSEPVKPTIAAKAGKLKSPRSELPKSPKASAKKESKTAKNKVTGTEVLQKPCRRPPASWEVVKEDSREPKRRSSEGTKKPETDKLYAKVELDSETSVKGSATATKTPAMKSAFSRRSGPGFVLPGRGKTEELVKTKPLDMSQQKSSATDGNNHERSAASITSPPESKTGNISLHRATCITPKVPVDKTPQRSTSTTTPRSTLFSPNLTFAGSGQIVHGFAQEFHGFFRSSSVEKLAMQSNPKGRCLLEPALGVAGSEDAVERAGSSLSIDGYMSSSSTEPSPLDLSLKKTQQCASKSSSPTSDSASTASKPAANDPKSNSSSDLPTTNQVPNKNNNCALRDPLSPCNCNAATTPFPVIRHKLLFTPNPSDTTTSVVSSSDLRPVCTEVSNMSPQKSFRSNVIRLAAQRFYDALLDEEVSLYACRLHPRAGVHGGLEGRCDNPVALLLAEGDSQVKEKSF